MRDEHTFVLKHKALVHSNVFSLFFLFLFPHIITFILLNLFLGFGIFACTIFFFFLCFLKSGKQSGDNDETARHNRDQVNGLGRLSVVCCIA